MTETTTNPTRDTGRINLTVNGEERKVERGTTVAGLLEELDLEPRTVVVERNREIIPRDDYGEVTLRDDDTLELVHFVGGG